MSMVSAAGWDKEVRRNLFPAPMQLPTHGQKWSNMATQRLLTAQCFARSGRTICTASSLPQHA